MKWMSAAILFIIPLTGISDSEYCLSPGCGGDWRVTNKMRDDFSGESSCVMQSKDNSDRYIYTARVIIGYSNGVIKQTLSIKKTHHGGGVIANYRLLENLGKVEKGRYKIDDNGLTRFELLTFNGSRGSLEAGGRLDNSEIRKLKKGHYLAFRMADGDDVVSLSLAGFTKAYNECTAYMNK